MIRVGILGCASIARRSLAPAFSQHDEFDLVAVASRTLDKAKEFASNFGARACTYDDLIRSKDIDLIYCPLPTGLHYEWVAKCISAGKHVLCEKSLGVDIGEVSKLVEIARANNRFLMESFQFRFHPQNLYVKELLEKEAIGPIHNIFIRFGIPPFQDGAKNIRYSAELGGGALLDNGAYTIKATTYLLGPDIEVLAAAHSNATASLGGVDIAGSVMMQTNCGISIQTAYGFDHFYQNGYEIWGRDGKISTTRAFTAREDFAAPVVLENPQGRTVKTFKDDHFTKLLEYVLSTISLGDFEREYSECILQAKILHSVKEKMR